MKTLGIIGGLGPMATVYFMERIISMTQAGSDCEHIPMFVYNNPNVPDRTRYILGTSEESPYPQLLSTGEILKAHCDCIVLPCATAHIFHERLQKELEMPVFNMIQETSDYLKKEGITCAGLLATDGTIAGGLFRQSLKKNGIKMLIPKEQEQKKVMHLIYDGMKADGEIDIADFQRISDSLRKQGAQVIILGCTELSILNGRYELGAGYVDILEVTAAAIIKYCGGRLKPQYETLITCNPDRNGD